MIHAFYKDKFNAKMKTKMIKAQVKMSTCEFCNDSARSFLS